MPKLAINIGLMPRQLAMDEIAVTCTMEDELLFSTQIGQPVLLAAANTPGGPIRYFATATLSSFGTGPSKTTQVRVTNIQFLPSELEASGLRHDAVLSQIDDSETVQKATTIQTGGDEFGSAFAPLEVFGAIDREKRERNQQICSLSGVWVARGEAGAAPIRPMDRGGEIHTRNFLYLHNEPAALFARFAWTVGPDFEIVVDSWAMGNTVLSTINATGKILLGDDQDWWPDQTALTWHREQFLDRLR